MSRFSAEFIAAVCAKTAILRFVASLKAKSFVCIRVQVLDLLSKIADPRVSPGKTSNP